MSRHLSLRLVRSIAAIFLLAGMACIRPFFSLQDHTWVGPTVSRGIADFDWQSVTATKELHYTTCYQYFECARLSMPLDWHNSSNPHRVSLAVIRLPATVAESDPSHGGTIITNPGGPGGSGVQQALHTARRLQDLLNGPRSYEILSFDPRGVLHSEPNAYCFADAVQAEMWARSNRAAGPLTAGEYALKYNWAAGKARGELCAETEVGRFDDGQNIRQHMSTAYVARDMLEIIQRIEYRRAREKPRHRHPDATASQIAKLQYLGTSYGTFLGQTFAAMYPDRVKRMVLDSNLDASSWTSQHHASIDDTAAIQEYFFSSCFNARSECALYRENDTSSSGVKARFDRLMSSLDEAPSWIGGGGSAAPVTSADLRQGFFTTSYQPLWLFRSFAKFANDLLTNIDPGAPFWQPPVPDKTAFGDILLKDQYQNGEPSSAVHCADGPDLVNEGLAGFRGYLSNLTSRYVSGVASQAAFKLPCWTWPSSLRTKWRYDGPFNATVPILFVNNRLDPVTPLRSAKKMSECFNSSTVLEQESVGHGALWPAGPCVWKHMKNYFDTGELPRLGTVCQPLCRPFSGGTCEDIDEEYTIPSRFGLSLFHPY